MSISGVLLASLSNFLEQRDMLGALWRIQLSGDPSKMIKSGVQPAGHTLENCPAQLRVLVAVVFRDTAWVCICK